jgi:hypothetical protein
MPDNWQHLRVNIAKLAGGECADRSRYWPLHHLADQPSLVVLAVYVANRHIMHLGAKKPA